MVFIVLYHTNGTWYCVHHGSKDILSTTFSNEVLLLEAYVQWQAYGSVEYSAILYTRS